MAGVNESNYKSNSEGSEVAKQSTPAMGGAEYRASIGLPADVPVVASAHLTDGPRAEGVAYPETPGVNLDTGPYPAGTPNAGDSTSQAA